MYYDAPICWRERHDAWNDEQSGHLFSQNGTTGSDSQLVGYAA
jgi:hypothetical protein